LGASGDEGDEERNRHHGEQSRLHLLRWVSGAGVIVRDKMFHVHHHCAAPNVGQCQTGENDKIK
jgi:hypothetical protein